MACKITCGKFTTRKMFYKAYITGYQYCKEHNVAVLLHINKFSQITVKLESIELDLEGKFQVYNMI